MLSRSSRPKWDPRNWLRSSRDLARSPQIFSRALAEERQGLPKAVAKESPQKCADILLMPYKIIPQVSQGSPPRQHPGMANIPHGHRAAQQSGCQGAGHPGKKQLELPEEFPRQSPRNSPRNGQYPTRTSNDCPNQSPNHGPQELAKTSPPRFARLPDAIAEDSCPNDQGPPRALHDFPERPRE